MNILGKKRKEETYDKFWVQTVKVKRITERMDLFVPLTTGKRVLHFGCTDWPIFDPDRNLHIELSKITKELHGFDIDREGIENLKKYVNQPYFTSFAEVPKERYDVVLIPETIEHVDNVAEFLKGLDTINAERFVITAPNAFAPSHMSRNIQGKDDYTEIVHPDHNCWYSPYTLKNVIEKYSKLKVAQVYTLNHDTMVCCEATLEG